MKLIYRAAASKARSALSGGNRRFMIVCIRNSIGNVKNISFVPPGEQWLERTLDDSSTRRLSLPEPFLALDGALDLVVNVASGIVVYEKTIATNLAAELPFLATENLMMAAVQAGADRQEDAEIPQETTEGQASERNPVWRRKPTGVASTRHREVVRARS